MPNSCSSDDFSYKDPHNIKYDMEETRNSYFVERFIRIFTVIAYLAGVSGAGVLMSLYYVLLWEPEFKSGKPTSYLKENQQLEFNLKKIKTETVPKTSVDLSRSYLSIGTRKKGSHILKNKIY